MQYALDRGNQQDWFAARDIRIAALLGAIGLIGFIGYGLARPGRAVLDVRIFKDRNFATACLLMFAMGIGLFGGLVIQPILLERLLNYPIVTTGLVMAPRGLATAIAMLIVGRLIGRVDARLLIGFGILLSAVGSYAMTFYSLEISTQWIIGPLFLQGIGLGFIFVPLSTLAYATMDRQRTAEAAGIFSLVRTMGGAVGISLASTVLTRMTQVVWNELGGNINTYNTALQSYFQRLGLSPTDPHAIAILGRLLGTHAEITAMLDVFKLITWSFVLMLPALLLLRSARHASA
jgi:DHA2 family multidrug resistance protein